MTRKKGGGRESGAGERAPERAAIAVQAQREASTGLPSTAAAANPAAEAVFVVMRERIRALEIDVAKERSLAEQATRALRSLKAELAFMRRHNAACPAEALLEKAEARVKELERQLDPKNWVDETGEPDEGAFAREREEG